MLIITTIQIAVGLLQGKIIRGLSRT